MAQFASDAFPGTEGQELTAYNAAWTRHTGYTVNCEIASGRVRPSAVGTTGYWHSGSPASADYSVSADLFVAATATVGAFGVIGRVDTAALTFYVAQYSDIADNWELRKAVANTITLLGSSAQTLSGSTSYNVKLEMIGTAIKLYKEGSGTATISVTDSAITAVGKSGLRPGSSATPSDTTGIHFDNFSADDVASGATGTLAVTAANDTLAASGTTTVTGTLAVTAANDTIAASGQVTISGTLAETNADDTLAASGQVTISGTAAVTAGNDTLAASGSTTVAGSLAETNANDTLAASGFAGTITGTLAVTAGGDTVSASGTGPASATVDGGGKWIPQGKAPKGVSYHLGAEPPKPPTRKVPVEAEEQVGLEVRAQSDFERAANDIAILTAKALAQNAALSQIDAEILAIMQVSMRREEAIEDEDILILMLAA